MDLRDDDSLLLRVLNTPALRIEEANVPGGLRARGHGHESAHLCAVLNGEFVEGGARPVTLQPGMVRTSPAGDEHDLQFGAAGAHCLVILVDATIAEGAPLPASRQFWRPSAPELIQQLQRTIRDASASPLEIELRVLELLAHSALRTGRMVGRERRPPTWLLRVRDAMHSGETSLPTTVELAAEAGLHPIYVARAFRRWFGCSLASYARAIRLEHARRLIVQTTRPLAAIAAETGFADQAHLTRLLRQRTGFTPALLRRNPQVSHVQDLTVKHA
jgi:AraC family transcriptional regulator